jgi:hypothetical protein
MSGEWMLHRSSAYVPMFGTPTTSQYVTFSKGANDETGYQWYVSNQTDTEGAPVLEIGFKEEINAELGRDIFMKFKGRTLWDEGDAEYYNYWSKHGNVNNTSTNSHADPGEILVATINVNNPDMCFSMDSVDLGNLCVDGECIARDTVNDEVDKIQTMILQRKELCGDDRWLGVRTAGGFPKCP